MRLYDISYKEENTYFSLFAYFSLLIASWRSGQRHGEEGIPLLFSVKDRPVGVGEQPVFVLTDENIRMTDHHGRTVSDLLLGLIGRIGHIPLDYDLEIQGRPAFDLEAGKDGLADVDQRFPVDSQEGLLRNMGIFVVSGRVDMLEPALDVELVNLVGGFLDDRGNLFGLLFGRLAG